MRKKNKNIYLDILYIHLKSSILVMVIAIVIASVFVFVFKEQLNAKENGEKLIARVTQIEESITLSDEKRKIHSITIQYYYQNKTYTYTMHSAPYESIQENDFIEIYIMNHDPNDVMVPGSDMIFLAFIPITIVFIANIYSFFSAIRGIRLYKKVDKNSETIKANYSHVQEKRILGYPHYYIICESDQVNGTQMMFISHPYTEKYVKSEIEKRNIKQFTIKYNKNNVKQYIMDTDRIDRVLYK